MKKGMDNLHRPVVREHNTTAPVATRELEFRRTTMRRCLPNITEWIELWLWPRSQGSVAFFSKLKPKGEKVAIISP